VQDSTYFAELHISQGENVVQIDARPSDSIAIALRLAAPIFAQESLLTAVAADEDEDEEEGEASDSIELDISPATDELSAEQLKAYLENLRPEDFGKFTP
jgi:hypothetical protein